MYRPEKEVIQYATVPKGCRYRIVVYAPNVPNGHITENVVSGTAKKDLVIEIRGR